MNKKKIIGLLISIIGVVALVLTILYAPATGLSISNQAILLFITSLVLLNGGIGLYQIQNTPAVRKRYTRISFMVVISIILFGFLLKFLHAPGGGVLSIFGTFYLSFGVIPVIGKNRFERWKNYTTSRFQIIGLMIFDSFALVFLLWSALFKLQHWPGASPLLMIGIVLIIAALILWNKKFETMFSFQIEAQAKLEEQHNEILDSINYAKRIQSAILPPIKVIKEHLQDSFVLYKPKDVVAGDFYWLESFAVATDSKGDKTGVLFAAADCTGHGVPGAMVSVVCNNGLNRSVREYGLTEPGDILDKTREIVIQEFEKSEEEVKDGMDIALCSLEGRTLKYAGAHNPLWIIRNNEVIEIKANKQPIGQFENQLPYTTHTVELFEGDTIYLFSDGYVDQFGGEKGKKFKSKAFKALLLSVQEKTLEEQKILIDEAFEAWKGKLEQIDDVCVIGVRV